MERIVVTGGSGKAGRAVVADLREHGYEAVDVDVATDRDPDAPTLVADLAQYAEAVEALPGAHAVVHLAAIPAPNIVPDATAFSVNTLSTYNVFAAAALHGLERVVWASSETLIGLPFDREQPRYPPIDEEHPRLPESHYALSKLAGEAIGEQSWRSFRHQRSAQRQVRTVARDSSMLVLPRSRMSATRMAMRRCTISKTHTAAITTESTATCGRTRRCFD